MTMTDSDRSNETLFLERALILGCSDQDAALWGQIATRKRWSFAVDKAEFDRSVLDYMVSLGAGDTWRRDLEVLLEGL